MNNSQDDKQKFFLKSKRRYVIALAISCLLLQMQGTLLLSVIATSIWLSFFFAHASSSLAKRFLRIKFWIFSTVLVLASGILLGPTSQTFGIIPFSLTGFIAGCLMLMRAALIFSVTLWLSKNISKNELLFFTKTIGVPQIGIASNAAFQLLPDLSNKLSEHMQSKSYLKLLTPRILLHLFIELLLYTTIVAEQQHKQKD